MNVLFRVLLAINATSWMIVVYVVKESITFRDIPTLFFGVILLCVPVCLSAISIKMSSYLESDTLGECSELILADNEFLPTYLGYFFVSLSIPNFITFIYLYIIVFVFTYISQTQYFNPIFLIFRYHYYHILTERGTRVFVIAYGDVIRNKDNISFDNLKRINDTTYIHTKGKKI